MDVPERLGGLPADGVASEGRQLVAQREVRQVRVLTLPDAVEHVVFDAAATPTDPVSHHVAHVGQAAHEVLFDHDVRSVADPAGTQGERQAGARRQVGSRGDGGSDGDARRQSCPAA